MKNIHFEAFVKKQFRSTYDLTEWFVSFRDALKDLTAEQANQKIDNALPTIFEIVTHLIYWNERHLKKIRNEPLNNSLIHNELTFKNSEITEWEILYKHADLIFSKWLEQLDTVNTMNLLMIEAIGNIITHNSYHIGQIVLIRKLQKSWNDNVGVK